MYEDRQERIYLGDEAGRLVVFKEQGTQLLKLADIQDVGPVHAIHETDSTHWIASGKGLSSLVPNTWSYRLLTEETDGVPAEQYHAVFADQEGTLWLPSARGLVRFFPNSGQHHRFGLEDGLLSNTFNAKSCLYVPETGEIWLGSDNGINVFHPDSIRLSDLSPQIHLSRFLVNDEEHQWSDRINHLDELTLDYADNTVSFEFTALDYSTADGNTYAYQLVGWDEDRVPGGKRKFVRYANLPAGQYTFKVWAANADGKLSERAKTFAFTITPPFYQRWWFRLACILVIAGIIYGIFRYRLEQALKVERLRVKISSDLHDDVGGMLSGLAMQSELLELTATEEHKPKLARLAEISRKAMSRMRDTVWAIDARKDHLKNLLDRMREHAEETLDARGIEYSIQTNGINLERRLATDVRQNLYLIYKEAITNVAKHSNGDTVNISLSQKSSTFELLIHDNGQVKTKSYTSTGLGQSNMQMRAAAIDATLSVDTTAGFKVVVRRERL